jgi:hypothetical protein
VALPIVFYQQYFSMSSFIPASYISDLRFSSKNDLLQFAQLKKAYELQMQPLIALATSQGFENDWIFRQI